MNKQPSQELLSAYFDGEATIDERAVVEQWLHENPDARQELDDIAHISELIRSLPREQAPAEMADAVMRQAERATLLKDHRVKTPAVSVRNSWFTQAAVVLASTAALVLLIAVINPLNNPLAFKIANEPATPLTARDGLTARDELVSESRADHDRSFADRSHPEADSANEIAMNSKEADTQPVESEAITRGINRVPDSANHSITAEEPLPAFEVANLMDDDIAYPVDLKNAKVGDVISHLDYSGRRVNVVNLTVVDIHKAVNSVQYLLSKNAIPVVEEQPNTRSENRIRRDAKTAANAIKAPAAPHLDTLQTETYSDDMLVVYVETKPENFASSLKDLSQEKQIARLALEPAVDMEEVELNEKLKEFESQVDPNKAKPQSQPADKRPNVAALAEQVKSRLNIQAKLKLKLKTQNDLPGRKRIQQNKSDNTNAISAASAVEDKQAESNLKKNDNRKLRAPVAAAKPGSTSAIQGLARFNAAPSEESFQVQTILSPRSSIQLQNRRMMYRQLSQNALNQAANAQQQPNAKRALNQIENAKQNNLEKKDFQQNAFGHTIRRQTTAATQQKLGTGQQVAQQGSAGNGAARDKVRTAKARQTIRVMFVFESINGDAVNSSKPPAATPAAPPTLRE